MRSHAWSARAFSMAWTAASPACCARRASSARSSIRYRDNIAFGTAPALILFLWSLQDAPKFGWTAALALAVCCALRLARFNARLDAAEQPHKSAGFNTGVPAPAGAGLAFIPIFLWLVTGNDWFQAWFVVMPWTLFIAASDDLEPSDLQLVVDPDPARMAAPGAGGSRGFRRGAAHRTLVHSARDRASLSAMIPFACASYARVKRRRASAASRA